MSVNHGNGLPPAGPPGFRSFVGDMKRDFPTLGEFAQQAAAQKERKQQSQQRAGRMSALRAGGSRLNHGQSGLDLGQHSLGASPERSPSKNKGKYQSNDEMREQEKAERQRLLEEATEEQQEKYRLLKEKNERTKQKIKQRDEALHK